MATEFKYELRSVAFNTEKQIESTKHIKFQWFTHNNKPIADTVQTESNGKFVIWYRTGEVRNG